MVSVLLDPIAKYENDRPFDRWLEDFDDFVLASFGEIPEKRKKAILMQMIGLEVKKYADSLTTETRATYKDLTEALVSKFNHQANETIERHIFNSMTQEDENIDSYVIRLRTQALKCNYLIPSTTLTVTIAGHDHTVDIQYADITDNLIRDRVVVGIANQSTKTRLLREHNLTLKSAITLVRSQELADERIQTLQEPNINAIKKKQKYQKPQIYNNIKQSHDKTRIQPKLCNYCGKMHPFGKPTNCPAYGHKCGACGKQNHYSKVCRTKSKDVHVLANDSPESDDGSYSDVLDDDENTVLDIGMLTVSPTSECNMLEVSCVNLREWTENAIINGHKFNCKIDTGAEPNVMSKINLDKICNSIEIKATKTVLRAYGGAVIPVLGTVKLVCELNGIEIETVFHIVPFKAKTVIGLALSIKLNLVNPSAHNSHNFLVDTIKAPNHMNNHIYTPQPITINVTNAPLTLTSSQPSGESIVAEKTEHTVNVIAQVECEESEQKTKINQLKMQYSEVFDESTVGCMSTFTCDISLQSEAQPVVHAVRKIPFTLKPQVEKELERMEKLGVIQKVDIPTDWVSSMVVVKQPNRIRICLDPTDLNRYVKREHTRLPTQDETLASITNAKVFSKLDLKNGYWQLPLTEEASYLTTFNTPFGRYRPCSKTSGI